MSRILPPLVSYKEQKRKYRIFAGVWGLAILLVLVFVAYLFIARSGHWLVQDDPFNHVSWIVILDGQSADLERSDYAINLMTQGKADSVLILGRRVFRDKNNADFYAEDMIRSGAIDPSRVYLFRHDDPSTIEEAFSILPWLKQRNADTVLLLTSAAASARVNNIFNTLGGGHPVFITSDVHHYLYNADNWAFEREARKIWLREWAATLNSKWDLLNMDTLAVDLKKVITPERLQEEKVPSVSIQTEKLISIKDAIAKQDSSMSASDRKDTIPKDSSQKK